MSDLGPSMRVRLLISGWPARSPRGAVTAFCRENGVSRSYFYKVRAEARASGAFAAMTTKPSKPRRSPQQTELGMVELLVDTRRKLAEDGWDNGPISVLDALRRKSVPGLPSRATVARVFLARGVVKPQ